MTTRLCDEIAADALALVALPEGAPERARAEVHARACGDCTRALADARHVLGLIDGALAALPAPSPAALARASAPVLAELASARAAVPARNAVAAPAGAGRLAGAVAAAVIGAWALPLALARNPIATGAPFALSLGLAALAAVASVATVRWGGRVAAVFPALSALTAFLVGTGRALDAAGGLHCALVETMTTAGVAAAAWLAARGLAKARPKPELVVAAVGGGALAGHAALHLACGAATELPHVLAFHTGPVALFVGLALLLTASARRPSTVRESSRP
jgi:hypothetical protein